jgi:hypothetical protein
LSVTNDILFFVDFLDAGIWLNFGLCDYVREIRLNFGLILAYVIM